VNISKTITPLTTSPAMTRWRRVRFAIVPPPIECRTGLVAVGQFLFNVRSHRAKTFAHAASPAALS
jgi:hypothetical protein